MFLHLFPSHCRYNCIKDKDYEKKRGKEEGRRGAEEGRRGKTEENKERVTEGIR